MAELELRIPEGLRDSLPDDDEAAIIDMERAVAGWQRQLERILDGSPESAEIVDLIDRFEDRWERYDALIVELRAWGQSPIYAMAWRDLHASMIQQLYEHEELADRIDRERHARIVQDGIRPER